MSESQRQTIIAGLKAGTPYRKIAAAAGCCPATVGKVRQAEGIEVNVRQVKNAAAANRDYAQAERLLLLNEVFDKCRELVRTCVSTKQAQEVTMAIAVLIDKRRLEDGEVTSRTEINESGDRDRAVARLTDITQRRRAS